MRIYFHAGVKILRGFARKPFMRSVKGLLFVGKSVRITFGNRIVCGGNVKFEDYSEIQGLALDGITFGDYCTIGRGVMIRPSSYYGIDLGQGLEMGSHSSIGPYGYIGCSGKITIGQNVMVGPRCSFFAENHNFEDINSPIKMQGVSNRGIKIEDNVWIGSNTVILDGVTIGKGSVIGAGSLIAKDIPPYSKVIDKRTKITTDRVSLHG